MQFTFETIYHHKTLTHMARALRKTLRQKRNRRSHIFGWIVVLLGLLLTLPLGDRELVFNFQTVVTWLAILLILAVFLGEDAINGYVAGKRMLKGTEKAVSVFDETGYTSTTELGKTEWHYDKIAVIAETGDYFVFVFSENHAQAYDKTGLSGGTVEDFRVFLKQMTGKDIQTVR